MSINKWQDHFHKRTCGSSVLLGWRLTSLVSSSRSRRSMRAFLSALSAQQKHAPDTSVILYAELCRSIQVQEHEKLYFKNYMYC